MSRLLSRGAQVDCVLESGRTILMEAAAAGDTELVGLLLDRGADADHTARSGETARQLAAEAGQTEVVALLDAHRAGAESSPCPSAAAVVPRTTEVPSTAIAGIHSRRACSSGLRSAIRKAVDLGQEEFCQLKDAVSPVLGAVQRDVGRIRELCWVRELQDQELAVELRQLCEYLDKSRADLSLVFTAQEDPLKEFNIVFFGRTGTGKSTLIEALRCGDGSTISDGRSDFTTDVSRRVWEPCSLWDTPGIEGWGRSGNRALLEQRAVRAAQAADLVILAFDTFNQHDSEFRKIARWVLDFGKPALAVLNVRNSLWRHPQSAVPLDRRQTVCSDIRQHTRRIRDALSQFGLHEVTLVALNAKRAWEARTQCLTVSDRLGIPREGLEDSSNIQVLEELLEQSLLEHASDLRTGMLRSEARAVLASLGQGFDQARRQLQALRRPLFRSLVEWVRLVGLDAIPSDARLSSAETDSRALVRLLEKLQEWDSNVPCCKDGSELDGDFQCWLREALWRRLTPLRDRAVNDARRIIDEAFDSRGEMSPEEVQEKVVPKEDLQRELQAVLRESQDFLARRRNKICLDFSLDLRCELLALGEADTDAGAWRRFGASCARILGWVAKIASQFPPYRLLGMVASWALDWVRGKMTRSSREERREEQSRVEGEATREIHSEFERLIRENVEKATAAVRDAFRAQLRDLARLCHLCGQLEDQVQKSSEVTRGVRDSLPEPAARPAELLQRTRARLERDAHPSSPQAAHLLWLGERWALQDPPAAQHPSNMPEWPEFREKRERETRILRNVFGAVPPGLEPEAVREVCAMLRDGLPECRRQPATQAMARLDTPNPLPRVLLVGDYNTGKTSWIRRLRMEFGATVEGLEVGAAPTTNTCVEAAVGWLSFVDTPGFGSGEAAHEAHAVAAAAGTTWTLVFMNPTHGAAGIRLLSQVIQAARAADPGFSTERSLLVVNRSDEIGEPDADPQVFLRRLDTKREELRTMLRCRMPGWDLVPLVFTASAPYGAGSPEAWKSQGTGRWDGFNAWLELLRAAPWEAAEARDLVAREVLLEVLWMGSESRRFLEEESAEVLQRLEAVQSLLSVVDRALVDGRALWGSCIRQLAEIVQDRICTQQVGLQHALDQDEAEAALRAADEILQSQETCRLLELELDRSSGRIREFIQNQEQALQRRLEAVGRAPQVRGRFSGRSDGPRRLVVCPESPSPPRD